jgi:hypothetical protein
MAALIFTRLLICGRRARDSEEDKNSPIQSDNVLIGQATNACADFRF